MHACTMYTSKHIVRVKSPGLTNNFSNHEDKCHEAGNDQFVPCLCGGLVLHFYMAATPDGLIHWGRLGTSNTALRDSETITDTITRYPTTWKHGL